METPSHESSAVMSVRCPASRRLSAARRAAAPLSGRSLGGSRHTVKFVSQPA